MNLHVSPRAVASLGQLLRAELLRYHALAHMDNLRKAEKDLPRTRVPLLERLHEYPAHGVDLTNLVEFPPKLRLIPVKPIFLDVAWNYIDYPNKSSASQSTPSAQPAAQPKRGWFGFGRS